MQFIENSKEYDLVIVGSGAGGGMATKILADPNLENQVHEVQFFSLIRNPVMTGYSTSKVGIDEIGYVGNVANVWDRVPEDVLLSVGVSYEKEWIDRCIDQSKRFDQAEWDNVGNLLT
tara:strand:- start:5816 stop:6169 length:354 start_codon:yes stop_codon:yes gene_type:complete